MIDKKRQYTYLQEIYSRTHYDYVNKDVRFKKLYMTDIDRLWCELNGDMVPIVMVDLKHEHETYDEINKNFVHALKTGYVKFCFFVVCKLEGEDIVNYKVIDYITKEEINLNNEQYAEFMLLFRDMDYSREYREYELRNLKGKSVKQVKEEHKEVYEIFFDKKSKDDNERQDGESLHDYFFRKKLKCFCNKCRIK